MSKHLCLRLFYIITSVLAYNNDCKDSIITILRNIILWTSTREPHAPNVSFSYIELDIVVLVLIYRYRRFYE